MKHAINRDMTQGKSNVPQDPEPPRILSQDMYGALFAELRRLAAHPRDLYMYLESAWRSDVRWGRNRTTVASDWRDVGVTIGSGKEVALTNQRDPTSLTTMVGWADQMHQLLGERSSTSANTNWRQRRLFPSTYLWSDATFTQTQDTRLGIVNRLINGAEGAGMVSAGYLCVEARGHVFPLQEGRLLYARQTIAQCSLTVRDPEGTGSGWAGLSSYDWRRIDADKLAAVALDKCLKSRSPVRIEPGRYTLIMEPQATFGLVEKFWRNEVRMPYWSLVQEMRLGGPFHAEQKTRVQISQYAQPLVLKSTKIGERVMDPRINIRFDPWDPDLGCVPFSREYPITPVQWITNGVLTTLSYGPGELGLDAIEYGSRPDPRGKSLTGAFRIDSAAPPTSMDEMIATTARGLLVTRFWGVRVIDGGSVLCSGTTRDGLWLIERGKITHPVKNLRFTESPLFVLNQVEQIGAAVPIFSPEHPAVVPPMKVRDFSFTALEDAV